MSEPMGLHCPGCGQPPILVLDSGRQAFCGNETDCRIIFWDTTKTADELAADSHTVDFPDIFP